MKQAKTREEETPIFSEDGKEIIAFDNHSQSMIDTPLGAKAPLGVLNREEELKEEFEKLRNKNTKWIQECGNDEPTPFENRMDEISSELKGIAEGRRQVLRIIKKLDFDEISADYGVDDGESMKDAILAELTSKLNRIK